MCKLSLSTITMIIDFPSDFGNPSMKSMEISENIVCGIGKGCNNFGVGINSGFHLWQIEHILTNSLIDFHKLFQ